MRRLLIANRGEVALRILRACGQASVTTIAAYTRVDHGLHHLELADETVCIGHSSYMEMDQLLAAATTRDCDAVHPGYGFLSENADFADRAEAAGLTFVGPTAEQIRMMGNKSQARRLLASRNVPVLPGSSGPVNDVDEARRVAAEIGYPVLLKASHGGGGRGIRLVRTESDFSPAFTETENQADTFFGNGELYVEKYLPDARHIEIQVAGDGAGRVVYLGARDCSVQRRNQKLIEEAPPPGIEEARLDELASVCCAALAEPGYRNLGTLEFLFDGDAFYFIEMNTRLQVEHPVTEAVTGLDLVNLQLHIAAYKQLPFEQAAVVIRGHAIECRINAEDAQFRPSPGLVTDLKWPGGPGVRVDSHLYSGYRIPHEYDSLVAKLICTGQDRPAAIARMALALHETKIGPVNTNLALHRAILEDEAFRAGAVSTRFLAERRP